MEISFDPVKRDWTMAERQLDFADAERVFAGTTLTQEDDRDVYPEPRFQTYGRLDGRIVLVVWTPTDAGVRVISMRNCHDKESRRIAPRLG
ncbi:BrnT family toxin [Sphingomonas sp. HMP9]|uniref:BrnT family toxin n=1 Tax=Sphingomonas sp. HMP9 TaxID=1517554 RepID=UPI001596D7A1|nr:BrnT family toxin [Sphingomonas sp. HMP9]